MSFGKLLDKEDGYYKQLGRIDYVQLGVEDHGLLHLTIGFDFGGSGQGFQCVLDTAAKTKDDKFIGRIGSVFGCEMIRRLCHIFGLETIQDLVGKTAYAIYESDEYQSSIRGIENPTFNSKYSKIRKLVVKEVMEECKKIEQIEKGEIPFQEVEWS